MNRSVRFTPTIHSLLRNPQDLPSHLLLSVLTSSDEKNNPSEINILLYTDTSKWKIKRTVRAFSSVFALYLQFVLTFNTEHSPQNPWSELSSLTSLKVEILNTDEEKKVAVPFQLRCYRIWQICPLPFPEKSHWKITETVCLITYKTAPFSSVPRWKAKASLALKKESDGHQFVLPPKPKSLFIIILKNKMVGKNTRQDKTILAYK